MLLSEAKEQAQVLLNEAFYAYHANERLINKMHYGTGVFGEGVYLLASADPNYKGAKNGLSWMVPNNGISNFFGKFIHKCLIPGKLDQTVLYYHDLTFARISKGEIQKYDDIEPWLKAHNAPKYFFEKFKERYIRKWPSTDMIRYLFKKYKKNLLYCDSDPDLTLEDPLCHIFTLQRLITELDTVYFNISTIDTEYLEATKFTEFKEIEPRKKYAKYAKYNSNKFLRNISKLVSLIEEITNIRQLENDTKTTYKKALDLFDDTIKFFKLDSNIYYFENIRKSNDLDRIKSGINKIFKDNITLALHMIKYYFDEAAKWLKNTFFIKECVVTDRFTEFEGSKKFLKNLGIIGIYVDYYNGNKVPVEEIFIFYPEDVKIVEAKNIGELDPNEKEITWDENGYPAKKHIKYDSHEYDSFDSKQLAPGDTWYNTDDYIGLDYYEYKNTKNNNINPSEKSWRENPRNRVSYTKGRHQLNLEKPIEYTAKNPHYRPKFNSDQPSLGDNPLYKVPSQSEYHKKIEKYTPMTNLPKKVKF